jgi:hypothetical protein
MNFYSDTVLNHIVSKCPLEKIDETIHQFELDVKLLFAYLAKNTISLQYIQHLLSDNTNKIVFRCMDTTFSITSCPSAMIYRRNQTPTSIDYYILLICTKHKYKNMGYATLLLHDFIEHIRKIHKNTHKQVKIILSSLETAVTYYEKVGFVWTRKELTDYPLLMQYEKYEEDKEYFMMEYVVQCNT